MSKKLYIKCDAHFEYDTEEAQSYLPVTILPVCLGDQVPLGCMPVEGKGWCGSMWHCWWKSSVLPGCSPHTQIMEHFQTLGAWQGLHRQGAGAGGGDNDTWSWGGITAGFNTTIPYHQHLCNRTKKACGTPYGGEEDQTEDK